LRGGNTTCSNHGSGACVKRPGSTDMDRVGTLNAEIKLFRTSRAAHLFIADGSRIYDIDQTTASELETLLAGASGNRDLTGIWDALGIGANERRIQPSDRLETPTPRAFSLNVSQACNMSCGYCYADKGQFGGRARLMPTATARRAVDRLIATAARGDRV